MNNKSFFLSLYIILCLFFISIYKNDSMKKPPTPTEYIEKKKNKKKFKKSRKDWIENMHRSAPGDNWREIDRENRKIKTDNAILQR